MPNQEYTLGVDIGTTTIKVALIDLETNDIVKTLTRQTKATINSELGRSLGNKQDPDKILTALQFCLSGIPKECLLKVKHIGISGQMHGVVLWKKDEGWKRNQYGRFDRGKTSHLYTWQDGRGTPEFLSTLPIPDSHLKLASGLGCVTLFWMARHKEDFLNDYDCAGTIQDYVVAMLCGLDKPIMSVQNAASWGYFNTTTNSWNYEILQENGFPVHLLPDVIKSGQIAGHMKDVWYEIPVGTPVGAALGDLQCTILSRLNEPNCAVLNLSTSAQLSFQMYDGFEPLRLDTSSCIDYIPYFNGRYLAVAASLTGGNVMATFVKMLQQWTHELGLGVPESKIWDRLQTLSQQEDSADTEIIINPILFGERHNPEERASVSNITLGNISLGSVYNGLCKGIISNLHSMMTQDNLMAAGVQRIICSGTVVLGNPKIKKEIEDHFKMPLELCEGSQVDAAMGAALAMLKFEPY